VIFTVLTLSGPALGLAGWYFDAPIVFWIGVALAGLNLLVNLASGTMIGAPIPALFALVAAAMITPWYVGAAVGLLFWTALEAAMFGRAGSRRK
jgi:hypothetical protein